MKRIDQFRAVVKNALEYIRSIHWVKRSPDADSKYAYSVLANALKQSSKSMIA